MISFSKDFRRLLTKYLVLDLDECNEILLNGCSQDAFCNNTVGSYTCTCNIGYAGDGLYCSGTVRVDNLFTDYTEKQNWNEVFL